MQLKKLSSQVLGTIPPRDRLNEAIQDEFIKSSQFFKPNIKKMTLGQEQVLSLDWDADWNFMRVLGQRDVEYIKIIL